MSEVNYLIENNHVRLLGKLNFQSVPDIQRQLLKLIPSEKSWVIDFSGVTYSDSAGLALLIEYLREAKVHNVLVRFINIPKQMLAIAKVSDLESILQLGSSQ